MTPRNTGAVFDTLINVWTAMSCGLIASCEARWFFFSSRRRHTRLTGDWSSDVCSSDLERDPAAACRTGEADGDRQPYWHRVGARNRQSREAAGDEPEGHDQDDRAEHGSSLGADPEAH